MITDDVFLLITYVNFVYYLAMALAITGLIILRYQRPELDRPLKVGAFLRVSFCSLCFTYFFISFYHSKLCLEG